MLKHGLAQLTREAKRHDDWIYLVDHSIEFGTQKCLLVLGVQLTRFREGGYLLHHEDVTTLGLFTSDKSNAATVTAALKATAARHGHAVQIVSDHGSDLKRGVEDYVAAAKEDGFNIVYTYDITHKVGVTLKWLLEHDDEWTQFVAACTASKRAAAQTSVSHLGPPKPRDKARWLNFDTYVTWAVNIRSFLLRQETDTSCEAQKARAVFGWVESYCAKLEQWQGLAHILGQAKQVVKKHGLSRHTKTQFAEALETDVPGVDKWRHVIDEMNAFFDAETEGLSDGHAWLGTTDVIESIFGKYKTFSQQSPMRGVGRSILYIPAFVDTATDKKMLADMEQITMADLKHWLHDNVGRSLLSKRRNAFKASAKCLSEVNLHAA